MQSIYIDIINDKNGIDNTYVKAFTSQNKAIDYARQYAYNAYVKFVGTGDVSEKDATIIDETDKKSPIITDDENIRRFTEVVFDKNHKPMQFDPECQNCKQNIAVYVNYNNKTHKECDITIKKASIND